MPSYGSGVQIWVIDCTADGVFLGLIQGWDICGFLEPARAWDENDI